MSEGKNNMKRVWMYIVICIIVVFMTSCKAEKVDITGLYQWSEYSEDRNSAYKKSIKVSENDECEFTITMKDKHVSGLNANAFDTVVSSYLDDEITIDSKIKYGKTITVYSESVLCRYKHELLFKKNSVQWRFAIEECYTSDTNIKKENIEDKEYYSLEKYIVEKDK